MYVALFSADRAGYKRLRDRRNRKIINSSLNSTWIERFFAGVTTSRLLLEQEDHDGHAGMKPQKYYNEEVFHVDRIAVMLTNTLF